MFHIKTWENPTSIKLCISHKIKFPLPEDPLLKVTVLIKEIIRIIYSKLINYPRRLTPLATITLTHPRSYALKTSPPGLRWHGNGPSASSPIDVTTACYTQRPSRPLPPLPPPRATTQHARAFRGNYSGQSRRGSRQHSKAKLKKLVIG